MGIPGVCNVMLLITLTMLPSFIFGKNWSTMLAMLWRLAMLEMFVTWPMFLILAILAMLVMLVMLMYRADVRTEYILTLQVVCNLGSQTILQ